MAELKASELKYGIPLKASLGGSYLTATQIETPSAAEYAPEGALYLDLTKLGLPATTPGGLGNVGAYTTGGETAATTALPLFVWSTPLHEAKNAATAAKQVSVVFPTMVTKTEGKLVLRIFSQETMGPGIGKPMLEPKTATAATVSLCVCTVFCLGK